MQGRVIPYALMPMEPDRLTDLNAKPRVKSNIIHQGVEIDPRTGAPVRYHFADEGYGKPMAVDAADVIHNFKTVRPGQLRGISAFTPVVLLAHDLGDMMDATLDRVKLSAKWLAFIKKPMPAIPTQTDDEGKKIEELENAIIEYLNPGEEVEFSNGSLPSDTFEPFVRLILHMIAVGSGVSYELLSGDYAGLNYSILRGKRNDLIKDMEPHQAFEVRHLCQPVHCDVLDQFVMHGRVDLPGYHRDPWAFQRALWLPPGMEAVDPLKESKANTDQMKSLLRSPQEIAGARGRNIEDVLDEFKHFKQMCEARGLTMEEGSTALANNPAALGAKE